MKHANFGREGLYFLRPNKRVTVKKVDEENVEEPALQQLHVQRISCPDHSQDENDRLEELGCVSNGIKPIVRNIHKQMTERHQQQGHHASNGRVEQNLFDRTL